MTGLGASPWYEEILKERLQQGRLEGESLMVLRLLQRRLGTLDDTVKQLKMLPVG